MSLSTPTPTITAHHHRRTLPYIGDSDQDILAFISNLAHQLQTASPLGPHAFGLSADDLADIIAARDAYEIALPVAQNPATNSRVAVIAKNEARDEADRISRMYAQIIKNQPSQNVSDELKVLAGVRIEKTPRTRTPRRGGPRSFPRVHIDGGLRPGGRGQGYAVTVRFADDALGSGRMPREDGVTHMILHATMVGPANAAVATGPRGSSRRVVAYVTRNPYIVRVDREMLERFGVNREGVTPQAAVCVMLQGQWLNAKGEVGPMGPGVMLNVPVAGGGRGGIMGVDESRDEVEDRETLQLAA